jgi:hypothetical protein
MKKFPEALGTFSLEERTDMNKENYSAILFPQPKNNPAAISSGLRRVCVHLTPSDLTHLDLIRGRMELSSSALATRISIRKMAEQLELETEIKRILTEWEEGEGKDWVEFAGGVE